ncbi:MAG: DUF3891 family protein [Adhaeribacter sp.]
MIVRETPDSFVLITQHDHARLAGIMAAHWHPDYFPGPAQRQAVELAVHSHDLAWIVPDRQEAWDAARQRYYSFVDFPLPAKLAHYVRGIDQAVALDAYAGLLCSLHYATFPDMGATEAGKTFQLGEQARQEQLRQALQLHSPGQWQQLQEQVQLLKCCDSLSIYLCINEPGVSKAQEHPWYRQGLPGTNSFPFAGGRNLQVSWRDPFRVQVQPFAFDRAFELQIPYRRVSKARLRETDGGQALQEAVFQHYPVHLEPGAWLANAGRESPRPG